MTVARTARPRGSGARCWGLQATGAGCGAEPRVVSRTRCCRGADARRIGRQHGGYPARSGWPGSRPVDQAPDLAVPGQPGRRSTVTTPGGHDSSSRKDDHSGPAPREVIHAHALRATLRSAAQSGLTVRTLSALASGELHHKSLDFHSQWRDPQWSLVCLTQCVLITDGYAHSLKALLDKSRAEEMVLAARRSRRHRSINHMLTFARLLLFTLKWRPAMKSGLQGFGNAMVRPLVMTCIVVSALALGWPNREPTQATAVQSPAVAPPLAAVESRPPITLLDVGRTAEVLFDAARRANWPDADAAVRDIAESAANLPASTSKLDLVTQLQSRLKEAGDTVSARQRLQTMVQANEITQLVADLSEEYQTEIPYALVMLGYYGRELELGIAVGDHARLQQAVADLQQTWNRLEPIILQRGAVDDARRFTDIVTQLVGARTSADFVEPTRAELGAVVRLKDLF
jgi:hypothetical protein